jgi:membrane-associated PAP2 superfamily phosphatase
MVMKSLDYEQGNHFLVENSWFMDMIYISAGNFYIFFTTTFGPVNAEKWIRGSPLYIKM